MYKIELVAGKEPHLLWAEAIRDIGILFLVFAPLDTLLLCEHPTHGRMLACGVVALVGLALIYQGVQMEKEE